MKYLLQQKKKDGMVNKIIKIVNRIGKYEKNNCKSKLNKNKNKKIKEEFINNCRDFVKLLHKIIKKKENNSTIA